MPKYCFVLGSNSTLSQAEIISFLENFSMLFRIILKTNEVIIIEINQKLDAENIQSKLGGTIKIGEILDEIELENLEAELNLKLLKEKYISQAHPHTFMNGGLSVSQSTNKNNFISSYPHRHDIKGVGVKNNIIFGFSIYCDDVKKIYKQIKNLGLKIKKQIVENGSRARFVTSQQRDLSSVIVKKNKLISQGADILIIIKGDKIYIGKTLTVQDFEDYSKRDYDRPKRDIYAGLIPPKLAQILINLAQIQKEQTILDPFCGSGTIIQEAILAGYNNIIGSDIARKAIEEAKQNIDWLFKEYPKLNRNNFNLKLFCSDVKKISDHIPNNQVDVIVTEPHLGPVFPGMPKMAEVKIIMKELSDLYIKSFNDFLNIIKQKSKIVIIFPCWKIEKGIVYLPILENILQLGYQIRKLNYIKTTDRGSIIYSRPDQKVLREIFIFEKIG